MDQAGSDILGFAPFALTEAVAQGPFLMQRLHVGTRVLQGSLDRYAKRFDLVEVRPDPAAPFTARALRKWRKAVPPTFIFSVVLPPVVASLRPSKEADEALASCLEAAQILESPVLLIDNPVSVTPTTANRERLQQLVEKIPHDVVKLAWEPSGLWEDDVARRLASRLGLVLVADAARDPLAPGSTAYTRLRGLGDASRLSASRLDAVIERVRSYREAFVIIETDAPVSVARALREASKVEPEPRRPGRVRTVGRTLMAEDEEQE